MPQEDAPEMEKTTEGNNENDSKTAISDEEEDDLPF